MNPATACIFGYDSPQEMIAAISAIPRQLFVDPKERDQFKLLLQTMGLVQKFECEVFRKDGSRMWISVAARAFRENGVIVRHEGMCEDITESKLLRSQLLQAQKLESVGRFAAGIAHEINTPTQYVGDNVRFLQDAFQDLSKLLAVVFYDASHGSLRVNSKGNKLTVLVNGQYVHADSTLVPSDAYKGGYDVRDREMSRIFNAALDKGIHLTVIFDSCHSGGISRGIGPNYRERSLAFDPRDIDEAPDTLPMASRAPRRPNGKTIRRWSSLPRSRTRRPRRCRSPAAQPRRTGPSRRL